MKIKETGLIGPNDFFFFFLPPNCPMQSQISRDERNQTKLYIFVFEQAGAYLLGFPSLLSSVHHSRFSFDSKGEPFL